MSIRALKKPRNKRRCLTGALVLALTFALAVGNLTLGAGTALAFDCFNHTPKPISCPFVKVEKPKRPDSSYIRYYVEGQIVTSSGKVVHRWEENDPTFTLWHWRHYPNRDKIKIAITPTWGTTVDGKAQNFEFPASESRCFSVTRAGVFEVSGCQDSENAPEANRSDSSPVKG